MGLVRRRVVIEFFGEWMDVVEVVGTVEGWMKMAKPAKKKKSDLEKRPRRDVFYKVEDNELEIIKMEKISEFKDLRFESQAEFDKWLMKKTHKKILLVDYGQDIRKMNIAKTGEIIYCDFLANIYKGRFVNLWNLNFGNAIELWDNEDQVYDTYPLMVIETVE